MAPNQVFIRSFITSIILAVFEIGSCQTPISSLVLNSFKLATTAENSVSGAGYTFSNWLASSNFDINYSSHSDSDIISINCFGTAAIPLIQILPLPMVVKVRRVANAAIPDTRNFITAWYRISSGPAANATSGLFSCLSPKVTSMEAALLSNNINSGYDNVFQNSILNPHYNNIERIDLVIPAGYTENSNLTETGIPIFDRGSGDTFKIAAIKSIDASNNPTSYGNLKTIPASSFTSTGLLNSSFDYAIFVSDTSVSSTTVHPSTRSNQNIRGVFVSLQDLGITTGEKIYGYSLFGQDVVSPTHTLTNPATFPLNTAFGGVLDLVNVMGVGKKVILLTATNISSFSAESYDKNVHLQWTTINEKNVSGYFIEKSTDGIHWNTIHDVQALNIFNGSSYQFIDHINDNETAKKYFYRLCSLDKTNQRAYSKTVEVNLIYAANASVQYNPIHHNLFVSSPVPINSVKVLSMNGQLLQNYRPASGSKIIRMTLNKPATGIYLIHLDLENGSYFNTTVTCH